MKFYLFTIEQVHGSGSALNEYATKSDAYSTEKSATSAFYDKCAAVNKDLSDNGHTWMSIKICNSEGGCIKEDELGKYVDEA